MSHKIKRNFHIKGNIFIYAIQYLRMPKPKNNVREPARIQKGSDTGRFLFGLIGIRSARDERKK